MAAAQASENHGDKWGLTWCFLWGIYASVPTWTHLQNSLVAAEALSIKIRFHGTSLNDHKDHPNQHENSQVMQGNGASHCEYDGKSMETDTTIWPEFPYRGKAIVEQILASEKRKKFKRVGLIQVEKLTIWVRSFEIIIITIIIMIWKIITEFTRSISSTSQVNQ